MSKVIKVTQDFNARPYGRYPTDSEWCGENFRERFLAPALLAGETIIVDMTGYNRYGPSFIDEAFGGLPRVHDLDLKTLQNLLTIQHEESNYFSDLAWSRIEKAARQK